MKTDAFLDNLCNIIHSPNTSDDIRAIIDVIGDIPPQSYELLAEHLENDKEKKARDLKKKKRKEEYFTQPNFISFYSRVLGAITQEYYDNSPFLRKSVREMCGYEMYDMYFIHDVTGSGYPLPSCFRGFLPSSW